jgi:hypothetical protein
MINPGDALLKEGIPVPEPNTISSSNAFLLIEIILLEIAPENPVLCLPADRQGLLKRAAAGGRPYEWVILFSLFTGDDPVMTH